MSLLTSNLSTTPHPFNTSVTYSHSIPSRTGICRLDSEAGTNVYAALLILLAIVATLENVIVLITLLKNKILQSPSFILLGILACIDFITGAIVTPIKVAVTLSSSRGDWRFKLTFLWIFIAVVFFSLSTVLMISVDRFLHVWLLDRYQLTMWKLVLGLAVCWAIPLVITFSLALEHYFYGLHWMTIFFFLFCIVAMIVLYVGMLAMLGRHASANSNDERRAAIVEQRKAVKTTFIIICACLLMNLPPVVSIWLGFMGIYINVMCAITFFTMLANAAVNPMIYCLRMPIMWKRVLLLLGVNRRNDVHDDLSENMHLSVLADAEVDAC